MMRDLITKGRLSLSGWVLMGAAWPVWAGPGDPAAAARAAQAAQAGAPAPAATAASSTQPLGLALLGAGLFMFWLYARHKQRRS